MTCTVPGCDKPARMRRRRVCAMHEWRLRNHGGFDLPARPSTEERFWSKVDRSPGDCWLWQARTTRGYGTFALTKRHPVLAHRYAYELTFGPIPPGLQLDHLCRTPRCVNPAHLEPVTPRENQRRSTSVSAVNMRKTRCPRGHEYDLARADGRRGCRACNRIKSKAHRDRKRAAA